MAGIARAPLSPRKTLLFTTSHPKPLLSLSTLPISLSPNPLSPLSLSLPSPSLRKPTRVTTAPVEHVPPAPEFHQLAHLRALHSELSSSLNLIEKIRVVDSDYRVKQFFKTRVSRVFESIGLNDYEIFLLKCVVAVGQEHVLGEFPEVVGSLSERGALKSAFYSLVEMIEGLDGNSGDKGSGHDGFSSEEIKALRGLLKTLGEMEKFYNCIGGIVGYQIVALELLEKSATYAGEITNFPPHSNVRLTETQFLEIHPPRVLDLSEDAEYASQAALWGLEGLPELGEIYPLGGSADRLGLVDAESGECLPAAMLPFCGRTLLEGLIRDLQVYNPCLASWKFIYALMPDSNLITILLKLQTAQSVSYTFCSKYVLHLIALLQKPSWPKL